MGVIRGVRITLWCYKGVRIALWVHNKEEGWVEDYHVGL